MTTQVNVILYHVQDPSADPTANLTFDLSLTKQEKESRSRVVLPYTKVMDKQSGLMYMYMYITMSYTKKYRVVYSKYYTHQVYQPALYCFIDLLEYNHDEGFAVLSFQKIQSGSILYEPDENDDLDDSDPDDDLNI